MQDKTDNYNMISQFKIKKKNNSAYVTSVLKLEALYFFVCKILSCHFYNFNSTKACSLKEEHGKKPSWKHFQCWLDKNASNAFARFNIIV